MIKKSSQYIVSFLISIMLIFSFTAFGCSSEEENLPEGVEQYNSEVSYFGLYCEDENIFPFLQQFPITNIQEVVFSINQQNTNTINDAQEITKLYDALSVLQATGINNTVSFEPNDIETVAFTMTDNTQYRFQFTNGYAIIDGNQYVLIHTELLNDFLTIDDNTVNEN